MTSTSSCSSRRHPFKREGRRLNLACAGGMNHLRVADDEPITKADDSVRVRSDLIRVCDQDDGNVLSAVEVLEDAHDFGAGAGVEGAGGLVSKQNFRFVDQRTRDGHPLLLSTRELRGEILLPA